MSNDLLAWGVDTMPHEDYPTMPARKRAFLCEINRFCNTQYTEQHLNSWLAERKPLPRKIKDHLIQELLITEFGDTKKTRVICQIIK